MRIKINKNRIVTLKGIYSKKLHSKGRIKKLEKPYKIENKDNISILNGLLEIAICNMQDKRKAVKIKYNVPRGTFESETYNQFFVKSCNRANCLKCKRVKSFNYLKDRIFSSLDSSYFITIATDIHSSDIELDRKYKEFRILVKNFFDYHKLNNYTSYEIEGDNQMLHCHSFVLNPDIKSNELTTLFKMYSGYYTNGKIVNINKKNIDTYISKIVGYSSKFKKDTLDRFNTIEISENIYKLLKTDISDIEFKEFRDNIKLEIDNIKTLFESISNGFNLNLSGFDTSKRIGFLLSGMIFLKRYNFLNYVKNNIYTKNIQNQQAKHQQFLKKYGYLQFEKIDSKLDISQIKDKEIEFLKRWWVGNKTVFEVYVKAISFLQSTSNLFKNDDKFYIQSKYLFNNLLKKRISSNLSVFDIRDNYTETLETESFKIEVPVKMEFKEFSENTYDSHIEIKQKKNIKNDKEIDILSKFRTYKIDHVYFSRIIKNFIDKQNIHIKKDSNLLKYINVEMIKNLALQSAQNKANLKYKKARTKFEINLKNDFRDDTYLDILDNIKKWYGIVIN